MAVVRLVPAGLREGLFQVLEGRPSFSGRQGSVPGPVGGPVGNGLAEGGGPGL